MLRLAKRKLGSKYRFEIFKTGASGQAILWPINPALRERRSHLSYTSLFLRTRRLLDGTSLFAVGCAMPKQPGKVKKHPKAVMLGLGLDSDGHKRLTTGP